MLGKGCTPQCYSVRGVGPYLNLFLAYGPICLTTLLFAGVAAIHERVDGTGTAREGQASMTNLILFFQDYLNFWRCHVCTVMRSLCPLQRPAESLAVMQAWPRSFPVAVPSERVCSQTPSLRLSFSPTLRVGPPGRLWNVVAWRQRFDTALGVSSGK